MSRICSNAWHFFLKLQKYIKFEESSGDPARVQILYERAVSELPLFSELWLSYTSYLDNTLKVFSWPCLIYNFCCMFLLFRLRECYLQVPNVVKDVYSRAVRNCSWVGDLWVRYMLSLERLGTSEMEMKSVGLLLSLSSIFRDLVRLNLLFIKEIIDRKPFLSCF